MASQHVETHGDRNVITAQQFNGERTLASLSLQELAAEDALARKVVRGQRSNRFKWSGALSLLTIMAVIAGYGFFLHRGDFKWSDLFSDFSTTVTGPLIACAISWIVALFSGSAAVGRIFYPTKVERNNRERIPVIHEIAISKGCSDSEWRKAKKEISRSERR